MALQFPFVFSEHKLPIFLALLLSYAVFIVVYRRFFHPLSKVPGPFLPAVTKLYQSYYNRRYYLHIEKLHEKYGPIVRINPDEIHVTDPELYDKIYYVGSKYCKSPVFYNALCVPQSSFGTISNEIHRIRRGALNPMFSRAKVLELESIVQNKAAKVCEQMGEGVKQDKPVDLHHAFRAVSIDVISDFAFDRCYNFLDSPTLGAEFFEMARGIGPALWVFQQFPTFQSIALATPPWLAPWLSTPLGYVTGMQMECVRQIEGVKEKMREGKAVGRETIFSMLLKDEGDKPNGYVIPDIWQLKDEAYSVLVAAADTTGNAMTTAAFNVLYDPAVYAKLASELCQNFPDDNADLSYLELEKLPYLTAVVKEGLRLSFGVPGRLPRIVPQGGADFNGYFVPEGYTVGMSSYMLHLDPNVFSNPTKFDPDRWMQGGEITRKLERNLVPFGRGSRQCVGINLAWAELYVTLGTFFRRFPEGLRVWKPEGTKDVMGDYEDFFSPYHPYSKQSQWFQAHMEKA